MVERPILFSGPMVRAILEGRKTQTRRVVKPQPPIEEVRKAGGMVAGLMQIGRETSGVWYPIGSVETMRRVMGREPRWTCPYGRPMDRLWVRETWADIRGMGFGNDPRTDKPWKVAYGEDTEPGSDGDRARKDYGVKWKPSIHMPRWASRLTLEITGVRVERLKEITVKDIAAEGIQEGVGVFAYEDFRKLWDSLNAERGFGWNENPRVWVIDFRKLNP
jgi:hypothetical protein